MHARNRMPMENVCPVRRCLWLSTCSIVNTYASDWLHVQVQPWQPTSMPCNSELLYCKRLCMQQCVYNSCGTVPADRHVWTGNRYGHVQVYAWVLPFTCSIIYMHTYRCKRLHTPPPAHARRKAHGYKKRCYTAQKYTGRVLHGRSVRSIVLYIYIYIYIIDRFTRI